jgi:pyruvate formate lyase activating enzyme
VLATVDKDRVFYVESGGGVTFSGGEPLMQAAFLRACLEGSRERGHHTVVDTCGHAPTRELLDVAAAVDLFLFDLKLMDDVRHRELLGVSNRRILDNARALGKRGAAMWLRVPLLPGVNDDQKNLEATAGFARSLGSVAQVNVLPYHRTGSEQYRRLGRADGMESRPEPAPERVAEVVEFLSKQGLNVKVGG